MSNYKFSEKRIINFLFNNDNKPVNKEKIKEILYEASDKELNLIISELIKENILTNKNGFYNLLLEKTSECLNENKNTTIDSVNNKNKKLIEMLKRQKELKTWLTKDFYILSEIKKEYFSKYPDCTNENLQMDLNVTQYKIDEEFIILKKYKNATDYIKEILIKEEILNIEIFKSKLPENFIKPVTLDKIMTELQNEYIFIEFEKNNYINIKKLNELNIYISDLKKYCDEVLNFIGDNYFTIQYLNFLKFNSELYNLGFSELFYESILKQDNRLYSQKNSSCIVFSTIKKPTLEDIAKSIIKCRKIIDIEELKMIITKYFGFCMNDRGKTSYGFDLQGNNDEGMYYSIELEKIYANKNDYYAEVNDYNDII